MLSPHYEYSFIKGLNVAHYLWLVAVFCVICACVFFILDSLQHLPGSHYFNFLIALTFLPLLLVANHFYQRIYYVSFAIVSYLTCLGSILRWDTSGPNSIITLSITMFFIVLAAELVYQRHNALEAMQESHTITNALLNAATDSAFLLDLEGNILELNNIAAERMSKTKYTLIGKNIRDIFPEKVSQRRLEKFEEVMATKKPVRFEDEREGIIFDSHIYPIMNSKNEIKQFAVYARDITQQKKFEKELYFLATTDELTKLNNRRFLIEHLHHQIKLSKRYNHDLSLLVLDIDHFKKVNDTHGHHIGDIVLKRLAETMKNFIRQTDIVGRIGGEEFAILLPETPLLEAMHIAERLRRSIEKLQIDVEALTLNITVSIGVSAITEGIINGEDLLRCADEGLYKAKREGRNQVATTNLEIK